MSRIEDMTPTAASELQHRIALHSIYGLGATLCRRLIDRYHSAEAVFHAPIAELAALPRCGEALAEAVRQPTERLERAQREIDFMQAHHIQPVMLEDADYPQRLRGCPDAPPVLYTMGNTNFNAPYTISIVGTRRCTQYGRDAVSAFVADLQSLVPEALIVSGLALGIDGVAHRAALDHGLQTLGVLAHGLDHIYPAAHRQLACSMLQQGGLMTEYDTQAHVDKGNFLARNRIVAALADVTLVAESSTRGGSLVTARIAAGYGRMVTALPGRLTDERSSGCNELIATGRARLVTSAADLANLMQWCTTPPARRPRQQVLDFETVTPDERRIMDYLRQNTSAEITQLSIALGYDMGQLYELILSLETQDLIRCTHGNRYELR